MPLCPRAGARPVTPALAQMQNYRLKSSSVFIVQHSQPRPNPLAHSRRPRRPIYSISPVPFSRITRGAQIPIAHAPPQHVPIPAVSSLGGFRTPALGARGTVAHWAGIRNPSHERASRPRPSKFRLPLDSGRFAAPPRTAVGANERTCLRGSALRAKTERAAASE